MAAPTNAASEDSPCQPGAVHTWLLADICNLRNGRVAPEAVITARSAFDRVPEFSA